MLTTDESLPNLLFEYRDADIILRSHDSHHFRVPKVYISDSSPVLEELIQKALVPPHDAPSEASLPFVQLPESGAILHSLLTFIFPIIPLLPPTTEDVMELLSVAQKYQMASVLAHIRLSFAQQNPPSTDRVTALRVYSLAQKYGLRREALQAARNILKYPINTEDVEDMLDMMPGSFLHELWKYSEKVRSVLASDLKEFRISGACETLTDLDCIELSSSEIPRWLDDYIASIGDAPNLFNFFNFNTALARHVKVESGNSRCACVLRPTQTIRNFWEALTSVVDGAFEKAESALSLVQDRDYSQTQVNSTTSILEPVDVLDANLIIRSSDLVNFRVHKSLLAMTSPFFREDPPSRPQHLNSESIDGLPVVQLSEDAELLNCLISMLYPVHPVIHNSYDKVLYLLAAYQKYDMVQAQSSIRAEVNRGSFPAPVGTEAFRAYAIAYDIGLIPEMENAARITLDYPMTFETLGEVLRYFDSRILRDLVRFRKNRRDNLVTCLESFLEVDAQGPSSIWVGCPDLMHRRSSGVPYTPYAIPSWLYEVFSRNINDLKLKMFTHPLTTPSTVREEYLTAIQAHDSCNFCLRVHVKKGSTFCAGLERKLAQARDTVHTSSEFKVLEGSPPCR